jgi:hypothetical protein
VQASLKAARIEPQAVQAPSSIAELNSADIQQQASPKQVSQEQLSEQNKEARENDLGVDYRWLLALFALLIIVGTVRGARAPIQLKRK